MPDRTRLDVRDNELYKLILNQSNQREALLFSCRRVFDDLIIFNFPDDRKIEIINAQIKSISDLSEKHTHEINSINLSLL